MLPYLFSSLFSKLRGYDGEFGICPSIILYLVGLYESIKLEIEVRTGLICWHYEGVTGLNILAFTRGRAGDVQANLFTAEGTVNTEIIEDLLYFVYNNKKEDKILLGVIDPFRWETFSTVLF